MSKIKKQISFLVAVLMLVVGSYGVTECFCSSNLPRCCAADSQHPVDGKDCCGSTGDLAKPGCLCRSEKPQEPFTIQSVLPDAKRLLSADFKMVKIPWYFSDMDTQISYFQGALRPGFHFHLIHQPAFHEKLYMTSMSFLI